MNNDIILVAGRSGDAFKKEVVRFLVDKYGYSKLIDGSVIAKDFSCGEIFTQLMANQANKKIHFFQTFYEPKTDNIMEEILNCKDISEETKKELLMKSLTVNRDFMEMLIFGDAIKRADPSEVCVYMSMLPYSRQDKKDDGRVPISAKMVFDLIETAFGKKLRNIGVCELHVDQEQGFANVPVKTIPMGAFFAMLIKIYFGDRLNDVVIVSPDSGGAKRTRRIAELIGASIAYIDKRRPAHGMAEAENVIGDVKDKIAIIVDDIADSCGSLAKAQSILIEKGEAREEMYACVTHALMSISYDKEGKRRNAEDLLKGKMKLFTTNSVPRTVDYYKKNKDLYCSVINIAACFADLVYSNTANTDISFSDILKNYKDRVSSCTKEEVEEFLIKF